MLKYTGPLDTGPLRVAHCRACVTEGCQLAASQHYPEAGDLLFQYILSGYQQAAPQVHACARSPKDAPCTRACVIGAIAHARGCGRSLVGFDGKKK